MGTTEPFHLTVSEGPIPGQKFELINPQYTLGREGADILLQSPGVSRLHARLSLRGESWYLEDINSSNGTFLNGQQIGAEPQLLKNGDKIGLGRSVVMDLSGPSPATEIQAPADKTSLEQVPQGGLAATVAIDESQAEQLLSPPQLSITVAGAAPQIYTLTVDRTTIGRAEDNQIVVGSKIVSRQHASLERRGTVYHFVTNPEAGNPVLYEGRPAPADVQLHHGDVLRIGSQDPGLMVSMTFLNPSEAPQEGALTIEFGENNIIQIGRDPANDLTLDSPTVSRFHAQIERIGQRYRVSDLNSANGTFINGEPITDLTWVTDADSVRIGPYRMALGEDAVTRFDESSGMRLEAIGLNKWVRKDLNILKDISVAIQPREFVVVVGQSGGGKSTFLDAVSGYRPATHGQVLVNDLDLYKHFDAIRADIGYVPQKDIIHMELTVYQALDYAAQLRMPPDTTKEEREQRVLEVLDDLDLAHRKDVQISGLSGGQQKRVSIGVELLTKPSLFYLDEPSSGLDPGTETALMHLMRRLADQGRTIILVTHATKNVALADKVVFLARGGHLVWYGPPDEALAYFDKYRTDRERRTHGIEFDDIYAILEDEGRGSAEEWGERYHNHPAYAKYVTEPLAASGAAASDGKPAEKSRSKTKRVSAFRQFRILSSRNLKILTRDRFSLILMLAAPILISLIDVLISVLMGRTPFDYYVGNINEVGTTLFMLTVYGVMIGGMAQMREIAKESDVYRRERLVNLGIFPYVLSKFWVAAILAFYQAIVYTGVHYLAFDMPGGTLEFGLIYITLTLATMAGMTLGLFASAVSPSANAVPLILIMFLIPQFVLGGALIPVPDFISAPMSTRWAFEALMSVTGAGSDVAADACWELPVELRESMSLEDRAELCNCMGPNMLDQNSCQFPGLGAFYTDAIAEAEPTEPPPFRDPPPEPDIPPPPEEPEDQSDTIAVADYLAALEEYQGTVEGIQDNYKAELEAYQAEGEIYQAEFIAFQEELVGWRIERAQAVEPAEATIELFDEKFGWTYVNKNDTEVYYQKVVTTWLAQLAIITVLFFGIIILQKRKDTV